MSFISSFSGSRPAWKTGRKIMREGLNYIYMVSPKAMGFSLI